MGKWYVKISPSVVFFVHGATNRADVDKFLRRRCHVRLFFSFVSYQFSYHCHFFNWNDSLRCYDVSDLQKEKIFN